MSDPNDNTNIDMFCSSLQNLGMRVVYCVLILFLFLIAIGLIRNALEKNESFTNFGQTYPTHGPLEHYTSLSGDINFDENKEMKQSIPEDKIQTVGIDTRDDNPITVKLNKDHVPIDYWMFEKIGKVNDIEQPFICI